MPQDIAHMPSWLTILGILVTWVGIGAWIGYYRKTIDVVEEKMRKLEDDMADKQEKAACNGKHSEAQGIAREFAETVKDSFTRTEERFDHLRQEMTAGFNQLRKEMTTNSDALNRRLDKFAEQILELLAK